MKHLSAFFIISFIVMSCSSGTTVTSKATTKPTEVTPVNETIHITNNEGFDVVFKDNGFYAWLNKQEPKKNFYESTLEIQNSQYASEWNKRVANPKMYDSNLYSHTINYEIKPKKRYGLDVNYELFMYFKFFEEKHEKLLEK